jgi:serine/threonine protein kinase
MGEVWRARDERLHGRACAIKIVRPGGATPEQRTERLAWFAREAEVLAQLRHPAICDIRDVVASGDTPYLILELIEGRTLDAELAARGGPGLPEPEVLAWAATLCDALGYLHGHSPPIIFRDIKPQNIMHSRDGRVVLIDFGLARAVTAAAGTAIGTGGYAPPEQYQGLADARSDEYALAATLHHLLTGRDPALEPPFHFPPIRTLVPALNERVEAALARALRLDAAERFPTVQEFGAALRGAAPVSVGGNPVVPASPPAAASHIPGGAGVQGPDWDRQQEELLALIPDSRWRDQVRRSGEEILSVRTMGLTVVVLTAQALHLLSSTGQMVNVPRAATGSIVVEQSGRWPVRLWDVVVLAPQRQLLARFESRGDADVLAETIERWASGQHSI